MTLRWWLPLGAATLVLGLITVAPAHSDPVDGLIVPAGPVSLTEADDEWTGSIAVTNPTTRDIAVSPAPSGQGVGDNRCMVSVTKGSPVRSGTSGSVSITVANTEACAEPDDGSQRLVLLGASQGDGASAPQVIVLPIAKTAEEAAEPKGTGLALPTDDVFLHHSGDDLVGHVDVVNTTAAAVIVTPSEVDADCTLSPPDPPGGGTKVEPGASASIEVRVPGACDQLDSETLDLSVLTSSVDGAKYEYGTVTLEAEVDWSGAKWPAGAVVLAAAIAVVLGGGLAVQTFNRAALARKLRWTDPLVASADAPKSWLTAIATVGPALTALFSTTDLPDALIGEDPTGPKTLVLVSAAVALVLVAVATMITNIPAVTMAVDGKKQDCPRIWHFVLAAALTTTSAGLALAAVWRAASTLDLPGGHLWANLAGLGLTVALYGYACWSVYRFVERFAQLGADVVPPPPPKAIPPEMLAAALGALAPAFIGTGGQAGLSPEKQRRWLVASKSAASDLVELLATPDPSQATTAASAAAAVAVQAAQDLSATEGVPDEAAQTLHDAAADAQTTAAAAKQAADQGDDAHALVLAEEATAKATDVVDATREAAQSTEAGPPDEQAEREQMVRALHLLTTSPGDDYLATPTPSERRPLTQFMI